MRYIGVKPWDCIIIEDEGTLTFQTQHSDISLTGRNKDAIGHSFISRLWNRFCLATGLDMEVILNNKTYFIKTSSLKSILLSKELENNPAVTALKRTLGSSLISLVPSLYIEEQ